MTSNEKLQHETLSKVVELITGQKLSTAEMVVVLEIAKVSLILSAGGIVK